MRVFHNSLNVAGACPPRYDEKNATPLRRAWALACHPRRRAGFPRHRSRARPVGQDRQILTCFTGVEASPNYSVGPDAPSPQEWINL